MRDWKFIAGLIGLVILGILAISLIAPPASAYYYVQQGDIVYTNETVDISGVMQGVLNLAYYGGYDCYGGTQYLLDMPETKKGYYSFYIDPQIFGNKTGVWCKWNGYVESNGNLKAFTVSAKRPTPIKNLTHQNPEQAVIVLPKQPILPVRRVSDYLIARGDGFDLQVNGTSDVWIFGARDSLLDYHSVRNAVNITPETINTLSPGLYKILIHTGDPDNPQATVRYNKEYGTLQWFDPKTFTIQGYSVTDQTPENILGQLEKIYTDASDTFSKFNLEIQEPTITIDQIDSLNQLNDTGAPQAQGIIIGSQSYMDVRGYTNVAPGTQIKIGVDLDFNAADPWKGAILTEAQGDLGGEMRTWKTLIPLNLYNMASCGTGKCQHTVSAKTALADKTISTAPFYILEAPEGSVIPNKTIRYITGRYGPQEIVPTPTPVVVTKVVTQIVTQTITIPVTPSNEQVYEQQKKASEATYWEGAKFWSTVLVLGGFLIGGGWYGISIIRRLKKNDPF